MEVLVQSAETENDKDIDSVENVSTDIIEYKEIDEPCVALTIIGENRLTNAEIFVKRGFKFSFKAFFSTLVLTIMNMFIWKIVLLILKLKLEEYL